MRIIHKYAPSMKRIGKFLLILAIVLATQSSLPVILAGTGSQPGNLYQAAAAGDPVIAAAGDIACDPSNSVFNNGQGNSSSCRQLYTSNLLVNAGLAAVLALGDVQYYCGGLSAFQQSYALSWGRVKSITHPSVGNHEYLTSGGTGCNSSNANAAGYFQYYGSAAGTQGQGWYSFDVGAWHLIALNSNCSNVGGCASGSPQYKFLQADLAAHPNQCTLAYWHIPLFSSGGRQAANSQAFWNLLYAAHADVILNGHDHIYERFAPQNPSAGADPTNGIRQFTVGTGGADHTTITVVAANSQVRNTSTYGVLKLTLHAGSYDWQFVHEANGTFTDSGSQACHASGGGAPTSTPTSTPTATRTATPTATVVAATNTPTITPTATRTATPTATVVAATNTPTITPLSTNTPTSTSTNTLVATNTPTITPLSTNTPTSTSTNTLAATNTPTITPLSTNTPTSTSTDTLVATNTPTLTPLLTDTPTSTSTDTLAATNTPTITPLLTDTPTPTSTDTLVATNTPTNTPVSTNSPTPTATNSGGGSQTIIPVADSYVDSSNPTVNNGTSTMFRADGSPIVNSYLRFNVAGLSGTVTSVHLMIFARSSLSSGLKTQAVADNTWGETTITYNNAPPLGGILASAGSIATGTWINFDVTGYITANGTYSFAITNSNATAISLASRESGANAPQLVITTQ